MPLLFSNPGLLDPQSFTLLGASAKPTLGSTNSIGKFGTGLKYAIAITLRLGGQITIHSGATIYTFRKQAGNFRGKAINKIQYHNSETDLWLDLPFTLDYGAHWQPWHAMRELESNCRDEKGQSFQLGSHFPHLENQTIILIDCPEIEEAWKNIDNYFLSQPTITETVAISVHKSEAPTNSLFYRGILAYKLDKPTLFTYNIKNHFCMGLTEDRTLDGFYLSLFTNLIATVYTTSLDQTLIKAVLTAPENTIEKDLDFSDYTLLSPTFCEVVASFIKDHRQNLINPTAIQAYYKSTQQHDLLYTRHTLTSYEAKLFKTACSILNLHFPNFDYNTLNITTNLPENVLGLYAYGKIYISNRALTMGLGTFVGTCFEEISHYTHGHRDLSRTFQNYLIDTIARLSLELHSKQDQT